MNIVSATITGSLILNGVNISSITGSESSINALNSFTASAATTGSNQFNGNQTVTGSVNITGSLIVTGSIIGTVTTASYVLNAVSASYALIATTSSYALVATSASYALNTTTSSYALVATSASYAANTDLLDGRDSLTFANTGSNNFVGTQNINGAVAITGSLTTTGAITAQTLNVQQVTSSIVYSSGSNIFGNSISNTQSMTGSVGISGSLAVVGASTITGILTLNSTITNGTYTYTLPSATGTLALTSDIHSAVTLSAIGATANANGATLTGQVLNLQPADASFGGVVTTGTQTFAGAKTLTGALSGTSATFTGLTVSLTSGNFARFSSAIAALGTTAIGLGYTDGSGGHDMVKIFGQRVNDGSGRSSLILAVNAVDNDQSATVSDAKITISGSTGNITLASALSGTSATFSASTNALNIGNSQNSAIALSTFGKTSTSGYATTNNYLQIGAGENATSSTRLIGFGYSITANTNQPAYIGYIETSNTGETKGSLIFGTRDVTTDTAPTTRLTIASTGEATFSSTIAASGRISTSHSTSGDYAAVFYNSSATGEGVTVRGGSTASHNAFIVQPYNGATTLFNILATGAATFSGDVAISKTSTYSQLQLIDNTASGSTWVTLSGFPALGDYTIREAGVANHLVIKKTTGNVGIGTTSPGAPLSFADTNALKIQLNAGAGNYYGIEKQAAVSGGDGLFKFESGKTSAGEFAFSTGGTNRMIITSGGEVLVGTTTTDVNTVGIQLRPTGLGIFVRSGASCLQLNRKTSDGIIASFRTEDVERGSISIAGATTSYNTSSDYRLKEDLQEIKGLERVQAIKVYDYKWKSFDSRMDGVLAHELAEIIPYAVNGEKDEVDEDGNDKMQGVDYSKLVPIMIKAIQELKAEIDLLKGEPIVPTDNNLE